MIVSSGEKSPYTYNPAFVAMIFGIFGPKKMSSTWAQMVLRMPQRFQPSKKPLLLKFSSLLVLVKREVFMKQSMSAVVDTENKGGECDQHLHGTDRCTGTYHHVVQRSPTAVVVVLSCFLACRQFFFWQIAIFLLFGE